MNNEWTRVSLLEVLLENEARKLITLICAAAVSERNELGGGQNQRLKSTTLFFCFFRFEEVLTIFGFEHLKAVDRAEMLALGQGISETKNYAYPIWILTLSEIRGGGLRIKMLKITKKKCMRKKSSQFLNN